MPITKTETDSLWKPGTSGSGSTRLNNSSSIDATGANSVAEGTDTLAGANNAHAEGQNTKAIGVASHAENDSNIASGLVSSARGQSSLAGMGFYISTIIDNNNISLPGDQTTYFAIGDKLRTLGDGVINPAYTISNVVFSTGITTITVTGGAFLSLDLFLIAASRNTGTGQTVEGYISMSNGAYSHAEGIQTKSSGSGSHAEGTNTQATGIASHAEGAASISSGSYSHTEGEENIATDYNAHAEGKKNQSLAPQAHAEGTYNIARGEGAHVSGRGNMAFAGMNKAAGNFSVAGANINYFIFGPAGKCYNASIRTMYVRGDLTSKISSGDTIYWGHSDNQATYISVVAAPPVYTASGSNTVAVFFTYSGYTAIQIVTDPTGGVDDTWAYEWGYVATDYVSNILDFWTNRACFAEGSNCYAVSDNSSAKGLYTRATGQASSSEGVSTNASGFGSHAEGFGSAASASHAHAEGFGTHATANQSHAEGNSTTASGTTSHAEGSSTLASGDVSHAEGTSTTASAGSSHAEGANTTASASASHAGGRNATASRWAEWARSSSVRGQYGIASASGFSIDATPFILYLDESSSKFTIPNDTVYKIKLECAVINYTTGDAIEFEGKGLIKNISGTTSLVGAFTMASTNGDAGLAATSITVTADNVNDCLQIQCTGIADSLDWFCKISYVAVNKL